MLNIFEVKNINFYNFFNYARNIGVNINKELYVKKIQENNNGIFINNSIDPNQLLISFPKKLVIILKLHFLVMEVMSYLQDIIDIYTMKF